MGHKFFIIFPCRLLPPSSPSFNNTFCPPPPPPPPSPFFKQSSHIGIGSKIVNKDSIRKAIELGPPVSESPTKISKFHAPTDSEHKFYKARIKNWQPMNSSWGSPD